MLAPETRGMASIAQKLGRLVFAAAFFAAADAARCEEGVGMECFSTAQARGKIAEHGLGEPFAAMRAGAERLGGEAIGAKLCRGAKEFVYEVSVLKRDGRVVKITIGAAGGGSRPAASDR